MIIKGGRGGRLFWLARLVVWQAHAVSLDRVPVAIGELSPVPCA